MIPTIDERGAMRLAERIYRQTNRLYDRLRSPSAVGAARVEPNGGIHHLRGHHYCVLISYRRDGTPVPTPLWFGVEEGRMYFRTGAATSKLKRLRRDPEVLVAPSTGRGRPVGPPFVGRARILDRSEELKAERAIRSNYRWFRRLYVRLFTGRIAAHYVEIVPVDASASAGRQPRDVV